MTPQLVAAATGIALMFLPAAIGYQGTAADIDHTIGPLAASIGLISASEVLRSFRRLNLGSALVLGASCVVVSRPVVGTIICGLGAVVLAASALSRGRVDASFGGGWKALWG